MPYLTDAHARHTAKMTKRAKTLRAIEQAAFEGKLAFAQQLIREAKRIERADLEAAYDRGVAARDAARNGKPAASTMGDPSDASTADA